MLLEELRDPGQLQSVGFDNLTRVWKSVQVQSLGLEGSDKRLVWVGVWVGV